MKSPRNYLLPALLAATLALSARAAEKELEIRRLDVDPGQPGPPPHRGDQPEEKESVAFLGVETAPAGRTLGAQLGLPRDTGLVVVRVVDKSPAAEVLKEDDVLTRLDDQILVNMQQLGVLVRARKEGDEVKLTVVRGGKELTLKTKLVAHEVPKRDDMFYFHNQMPGFKDFHGFIPPGEMPDLEGLRELPGLAPADARDVLRMIGREHGNMLAGPGVRVVGHGSKGSTILDLPKSNVTYSDDDGVIEIKADDTQRSLTVKDAKGAVLFAGPVTTNEQRKNLPPEILKRLEKLESDSFEFEVGKDFKTDVVPLSPGTGETKISLPMDGQTARRLRAF